MAKHIDQLMAKLTNFGKQASSEATVSDPTEKGPLGTDVPKERLMPEQPGQSASTETTPAVSASEPAGDTKIEHGESTGKVGPAQSPDEPLTVDGAKTAGLIQGMGDLKAKLAAFGTPTAAPVATAPAATPVTEKSATEYVPGDSLLKVAFALMETAEGQSLILRALDESQGQEKAAAMVKQAADETSAFLRDYTLNRLAEADYEVEMQKQAAEQAQAEAYFYELTKGASAEQLQAIDDTGLRINTMMEPFTENAVAKSAAEFGMEAAYKIAAAMEQGMSPEEAAMMASGGEQGEEGPPSPEELEQALMTLVEQGVISPEEAEQLMGELMGAGGGAEGEMPPGAEGGMPPEMAQKQASIREELNELAVEILS